MKLENFKGITFIYKEYGHYRIGQTMLKQTRKLFRNANLAQLQNILEVRRFIGKHAPESFLKLQQEFRAMPKEPEENDGLSSLARMIWRFAHHYNGDPEETLEDFVEGYTRMVAGIEMMLEFKKGTWRQTMVLISPELCGDYRYTVPVTERISLSFEARKMSFKPTEDGLMCIDVIYNGHPIPNLLEIIDYYDASPESYYHSCTYDGNYNQVANVFQRFVFIAELLHREKENGLEKGLARNCMEMLDFLSNISEKPELIFGKYLRDRTSHRKYCSKNHLLSQKDLQEYERHPEKSALTLLLTKCLCFLDAFPLIESSGCQFQTACIREALTEYAYKAYTHANEFIFRNQLPGQCNEIDFSDFFLREKTSKLIKMLHGEL